MQVKAAQFVSLLKGVSVRNTSIRSSSSAGSFVKPCQRGFDLHCSGKLMFLVSYRQIGGSYRVASPPKKSLVASWCELCSQPGVDDQKR